MSKTIRVVLSRYTHSIKKQRITVTVEFPDLVLDEKERKKLALRPGPLTLILWDFKGDGP